MQEKLDEFLWSMGVQTIHELETERGILASGREEIYGCIFGRDSLLTSLFLLHIKDKDNERRFLPLVRKVLENLADLQGTQITIESGEEPGKCIHEFRTHGHDHLTQNPERPWYLYPDGHMRNYDSVDSTPLFLMAVFVYWQVSHDRDFVTALLPHVRAGLDWMLKYGDTNSDGFIDYRFHPDRLSGGLVVQSWMDSGTSLFYEHNESRPPYPIAPVEVQAYAYVALREWSDFFSSAQSEVQWRDVEYADVLARRADDLKAKFNKRFVLHHRGGKISLAYALDGNGTPLTSARSSMGHCLWAVWKKDEHVAPDSILDQVYVEPLVRRLLARDLFLPHAGIRTLSSRSAHFDPGSYHNGSVWPHDTAMFAEGLENFGFKAEATTVRAALLEAYQHFKTPLELFAYTKGRYCEYKDVRGQGACRKQAWSAGSLLTTLDMLGSSGAGNT